MLDSTGDAQSDVQLGMDSLTSLTNLMVGGDPAGVNDCTGGTNNAAQLFCQSFSQLDRCV